MQDAGNQNASGVLSVKHYVPAALHTTQAGTNIVARPAQSGIIRKDPTTSLKIVDITDGLVYPPSAQRMTSDAEQISFSTTRETKRGHRLSRSRGRLERSPHAPKYVAFGNTAGITFIDRHT